MRFQVRINTAAVAAFRFREQAEAFARALGLNVNTVREVVR